MIEKSTSTRSKRDCPLASSSRFRPSYAANASADSLYAGAATRFGVLQELRGHQELGAQPGHVRAETSLSRVQDAESLSRTVSAVSGQATSVACRDLVTFRSTLGSAISPGCGGHTGQLFTVRVSAHATVQASQSRCPAAH